MRVIACMAIVTSLLGCGSMPTWAPKPPVVGHCSYTWKFKKFRCSNSETKAVTEFKLDAPVMEGAQALSLDDYNAGQKWMDDFIAEARNRCDP